MTTPATPLPAARAAFTGLIDYAGLFPPAELPLREAIADYMQARSGRFAWMLERFIVSESQVSMTLRQGDDLPLSVILNVEKNARAWFAGVENSLSRLSAISADFAQLRALEILLPEPQWARDTYDAPIGQCAAAIAQSPFAKKPCFVEIPRNDRRQELMPGALEALRRHRLSAKLRCGGVSAESVPTVLEIAAFLTEAHAAGVAFKATAGLHHPIRGYDEERGFVTHGFLNLLTACALARTDCSVDVIIQALETERADDFIFADDGLHWRSERLPVQLLAEVRSHFFIGYGSCSFDEPTNDLLSLGMIA